MSNDLIAPQLVDFKSRIFEGPQTSSSALAVNLPYEPLLDLRTQLESQLRKPLKFHAKWEVSGESHVTVINPVEYAEMLKPHISWAEIYEIAQTSTIQSSTKLSCEGLGSAHIEDAETGALLSTYFVLLKAQDLLEIRKNVYNAVLLKGVNEQFWNPLLYFPHITVGFSDRDLYEKDGVKKSIDKTLDLGFSLILK